MSNRFAAQDTVDASFIARAKKLYGHGGGGWIITA
jgi:hypothetical protein